MIRFLVLRLLFPLLILFFLRAVLRTFFAVLRRGGLGQPATTGDGGQRRDTPVAELKKDPVCGTYVPAATSLTRTINGSVVHFCSPECRDKYRVA